MTNRSNSEITLPESPPEPDDSTTPFSEPNLIAFPATFS